MYKASENFHAWLSEPLRKFYTVLLLLLKRDRRSYITGRFPMYDWSSKFNRGHIKNMVGYSAFAVHKKHTNRITYYNIEIKTSSSDWFNEIMLWHIVTKAIFTTKLE